MAAILFLMRYPLDGRDNLKNKFDGQMAAVEALGHEAYFIGRNGEGFWLCRGENRELLLRSPFAALPGYGKTLFYVDLMRALQRTLKRKRFDAAYVRYIRLFGNAPRAFGKLKETGCKFIMEHPTYPFENGKNDSLLRRPFFAYCDRVFRHIEPMIDLYTLIGDPTDGSLGGRPAMNIVNGVDVRKLPLHELRKEADIGMLALASMSHWQGYDRLIDALSRYRGDAKVTVHMVGGEGDGSLAAWKHMAQEKGLADRVVFHGEKFGAELDGVIAECDIGIGGLGLYRKGQFCSMTLKLREYMARGLPFVYAVEDPSMPADERFCIKLPNNDTPIDLETLVAFARRAKQDASVPGQMRAYAEENMSWRGILQSVLERVGL